MENEEKILYSLVIEPRHKVLFNAVLANADYYRARNFIAELINLAYQHLHGLVDDTTSMLHSLADDALELTGFDVVNNTPDYKIQAKTTMMSILADIVSVMEIHLLIWNVPAGIIDVASFTSADINFIVTKDL